MRGRYFHYALAQQIARALPKENAWKLSQFLASIYAKLLSKDIHAVKENLRVVYPPLTSNKELENRAAELIRNFSSYLVDLFYAKDINASFIKDRVETVGLHHLDAALQKEKGVILASAHLGNWELGGMALSELRYPVVGLAATHADPKISRIFEDARKGAGLATIPLEGSMRNCVRVLKEKKILGLISDRLYRGQGIETQFFGKTMLFPSGLAKLHFMTGAPIVPGFMLMTGFNRYEFHIEAPIEGQTELEIVKNYAAFLEKKIRMWPTQWFIFQPFWEKPEWPS
ncbi:MAG TPA: lysophospholipid acyltransferase family protein [Candidatus Omnitrophota bacterium]|nr:lysophospholipid acyltransferase family protein [Candidatus Omnitrophota bacterium]